MAIFQLSPRYTKWYSQSFGELKNSAIFQPRVKVEKLHYGFYLYAEVLVKKVTFHLSIFAMLTVRIGLVILSTDSLSELFLWPIEFFFLFDDAQRKLLYDF